MNRNEAKEFLLDKALPILSEDYGFKDAEEAIEIAIRSIEEIEALPKRIYGKLEMKTHMKGYMPNTDILKYLISLINWIPEKEKANEED